MTFPRKERCPHGVHHANHCERCDYQKAVYIDHEAKPGGDGSYEKPFQKLTEFYDACDAQTLTTDDKSTTHNQPYDK